MPETPSPTRTTVAIVGAGPAGLMLSHLLAASGIDSVVVDTRSRARSRDRSAPASSSRTPSRMLVDSGVSDRVLRDGHEHDGIELRFAGDGHRIDFQDLVGAVVWLYPQNEVFIDLAIARDRDGGDVRFGVTRRRVDDVTTRPAADHRSPTPTGRRCEIEARLRRRSRRLPQRRAATGSRRPQRRQYFREYPFAWFGILCEAPPSAPELIYSTPTAASR